MGLYETCILPRLTHLAMRQEVLIPLRKRAVAGAAGDVLELGVGSGLNLPLYGAAVSRLVAIDTLAPLVEMARKRASALSVPAEVVQASAEDLPFADQSFDAVVMTWTLCSVGDVARVLSEVKRVLRPGGRLHFAEHGQAPSENVRLWQDRITPVWRLCAGNCHLNRPTAALLEQAGFHVEELSSYYLPGPKPMTFMYEGRALPCQATSGAVDRSPVRAQV